MQQTVSTYHFFRGTLLLLIILGGGGWFLYLSLKRSENPPKLLFKWVVTFFVLGAAAYLARGPVTLVLVPIILVTAAALIITWGTSIGSIFAKPFTSLYEDNSEIEPQPYYSIAEAKRKKGLYTEAIAHIRSQLDKFPTDLQGQMMLAEIQAENMDDLPGAELTIRRFCEQPGHAHRNIAYALNLLADWQLKYTKDREAAQSTLQKVVDRFPDSEMAILASQRIAHLATADQLLEPDDRHRVHVPEGVKSYGLSPSLTHFVPKETDPELLTAEYVKHLETFPLDCDAREKLAVLYADHFKRLDIAEDQLNQLIDLPNQPVKSVVRWINLLADLQVRHGAGHDVARDTLGRIVDRFPNHPTAELARNRMNLIKLEVKGKEKSQAVKLGSYEKYIGLKEGLPHKF